MKEIKLPFYRMKRFFEDVLDMPYYKNYAAASGAVHNIAKHEDAVEDLLIKHGIKKSSIKRVTKKQKDDWLNGGDHSMLPDNIYISQPCSTHNSPDFIVKVGGVLYFLECKSVSGTTTCPVYNSSYAKTGYIYIFACEKYNETTTFKGEDIVTRESSSIYDEMRKRFQQVYEEEFKDDLQKSDSNKRGLDYYDRPMYNQRGGGEYTDYFKHPDRERCEQNVLNHSC
tara:strand:- start:949 stop:1626 length:678 start_codon:yes stop_codon:yes gene_type:complete